MSARRERPGLAAALGLAIVAAHAAAFAALAARSGGTELVVEVRAPLAAPTTSLDGEVPPALATRVQTDRAGAGPGLVRQRWRTQYRGGFTREVGATQLVGPFQDPAAPPCSGRVIVGQRLLDQLAAPMAAMLDRELRGETIFPVGGYHGLRGLALTWARLDAHPGDRDFVGDAPHGYVRATVTVAFDRVDVPLLVAFVPERTGDRLEFRIAAHAELAFGNSYVQWLSDKLGASRLATRVAREQIDEALVTTLAPPPPFELSDGQTLRFIYCAGAVEIADHAWGALPFAVAITRATGATAILPPQFPSAPLPPLDRDPSLVLDLDLNAFDSMLYELWRTGWLDRQLADVGLDRRFNTDPTVAEYLSVRLSPVRLALPPVIDVDPGGHLRLATDARVEISDGGRTTVGRVWGTLRFAFAAPAAGAPTSGHLPVAVDLDDLELACERTPTTLVPCYADLVAALRGRGAELHGALTEGFAKLLSDIFIDRELAAPDLPVGLTIRGVVPSMHGAALRLVLDATVSY